MTNRSRFCPDRIERSKRSTKPPSAAGAVIARACDTVHDVTIDMVIFRENSEDLYSGLEHEVVPGVVTSLKVITRTASLRIAETAFRFAASAGRKKVAAIHKANIMKLADGLFLRCCCEVAQRYPSISYEKLIVDNASLQLVVRPETFDVLLLPNLYAISSRIWPRIWWAD